MEQNVKLETFVNEEFGSVRVIEEDGKYLFCGSDVAKALGYNKPSNKGLFIVRDFCKNGHKGAYTLITPSGKDLLRVLGGRTGLFPV